MQICRAFLAAHLRPFPFFSSDCFKGRDYVILLACAADIAPVLRLAAEFLILISFVGSDECMPRLPFVRFSPLVSSSFSRLRFTESQSLLQFCRFRVHGDSLFTLALVQKRQFGEGSRRCPCIFGAALLFSDLYLILCSYVRAPV